MVHRGSGPLPSHPERATAGQANGLLGAGDRGALWINTPALYVAFSVRIELHDHEPRVPGWCEDAVEVSYHVGRSPLVMGSFESFSRPLDVRPGEYRVRYCVRGLDATAAETAES